MASHAAPALPSFDRDLPALDVQSPGWQRWITSGISVALVVAIAYRMKSFGMAEALTSLPSSPGFWLVFAAYYLALPGSEWLIFRKLWRLPAKGFAALLRKLISNEILLGYSGEAYFYGWARQHAKLTAAPFGAIKDVSILSALAGNAITLIMLAIAWPLVGTLSPQIHARAVMESSGLIIGMSLLILAFRNRLFSLNRSELWFVFSVHVARLVATTILSGLLWHLALPDVPLIWLVLLATLQLLVTRLPFVPSKDLLFANLAVFLIGNDGNIAIVVSIIATALVATHLLLGGALFLTETIRKGVE